MRILVVEDEEAISKGLRFNFEREGYQVDVAGVVRQDGGYAAGHAFHGDQVGAAFATIGKKRDIGFADDLSH